MFACITEDAEQLQLTVQHAPKIVPCHDIAFVGTINVRFKIDAGSTGHEIGHKHWVQFRSDHSTLCMQGYLPNSDRVTKSCTAMKNSLAVHVSR